MAMQDDGELASPVNRAVDSWLALAADERQIRALDLAPDDLGREQSWIVGASCLAMAIPPAWGISMGQAHMRPSVFLFEFFL